jgi:RNA polymerase sigma-70 factor (ECF subfamily)
LIDEPGLRLPAATAGFMDSYGRNNRRRASNARVDSAGGIGPELLAACQRGDREAWRELYEAHKDRVYSVALDFFHGDAAAAADVTQQVFLKLMDSIASYRRTAAFSTWLHRIVVNACLDSTRRQRRSRIVDDDRRLGALADPGAPADARIDQLEMTRSVQDAIARLPPKLRIAVLLRYVNDLAYTDMAAALHCSIGTVSSRLSRAHRLLAQSLAPLRAAAPSPPTGRD